LLYKSICYEIAKLGNKVIVKWYYEYGDEDALEAGEDLDSITRVPFEFIKIEEV
jgi:hypothetical protein